MGLVSLAAARPAAAPGRRQQRMARVADDLERAALRLFDAQGFEETTVDELAAAAHVGRRTFFRYFPTKNDVVLGDFDAMLAHFRSHLAATEHPDAPLDAVRDAFVAVNQYQPAELEVLRIRLRLLHDVPELQGHAASRYVAWQQVVAEQVARWTRDEIDALYPQLLGEVSIATMQAIYQVWLRDSASSLSSLINTGFDHLRRGFA